VNVAERIVRQADRYTSHWDWNENRAHDGDDVYTMIDHILVAKELMPFVTRAFICHTVSVDTSDHYAVVVDLRLPVRQDKETRRQGDKETRASTRLSLSPPLLVSLSI
jgi:hypothetical protein